VERATYDGQRRIAVISNLCAGFGPGLFQVLFSLNIANCDDLARLSRIVVVRYETIRCWCNEFGAGLARRLKAARCKPGTTWHLDEMFVTLCGEPYLLWRAVDEHGTELDILLQKRRDKATAKRFFKRALRSNPAPCKIVTDQMRGFRDPKRTQQFLSCFGLILQHFALKRHLLCASLYRKQLAARFVVWREFTEQAQNPSTGF